MRSIPQLDDYRPTRDTLHAHAKVLGAMRRSLEPAHPRWWHISLALTARGFGTGALARPDGRVLALELDVEAAQIVARGTGLGTHRWSIGSAESARSVGRGILDACSDLLDTDELDETAWSDETGVWDDRSARHLHAVFHAVAGVLEDFRASRSGPFGPVQLWPHHFDLSCEWLGGRSVDGEDGRPPAQIGIGFSTGDDSHPDPYLYANPWPFEASLVERSLPGTARWHTEGWQGSLLPLAAAHESPGLARDYLEAVFTAAEPTLL